MAPKWICSSQLQSMARHCELVLDPKRAVRAFMVYHQYGFPQDMDAIRDHCAPRHIAIIENCAKVWEGYYKQELLGTLGLSGIFSLSKLFPSLSGVGLATRDKSRCLRHCFLRLSGGPGRQLCLLSQALSAHLAVWPGCDGSAGRAGGRPYTWRHLGHSCWRTNNCTGNRTRTLTTGGGDCTAADCSRSSRGNPRA